MEIPFAFPQQDHQAHITAHGAFIQSRMVQINPMVHALLIGHISQHVSLQAQGEIGALIQDNPDIQAQLNQDPQGAQIRINAMIAQRIAEITTELVQRSIVGQQKDPLVQLKQQEIDLKAMDMQRKSAEKMADIGMKEDQFDEKLDVAKMKLEDDEDQAKERIRVADDKMDMTRDIAEQKLQVERMKRTAEDRRTKAIRKKK